MRFYLILIILIQSLSNKATDIIISEIMAKNNNCIVDNTGKYYDWVEIQNISAQNISLKDYYLYDLSTTSTPWSFPDISIAPNEMLILFASDNNYYDGKYYHTNFKLSADKDKLYLGNGNKLIDSVTIKNLPDATSLIKVDSNFSYGIPTPLSPNQSKSGTEPLQLSHPAGFYTDEFQLALKSKFPDATIYYTLNGDSPIPEKSSCYVYSKPIKISDKSPMPNNYATIPTSEKSDWYWEYWYKPEYLLDKATTVRAIAVKNGSVTGEEIHATYFVFEDKEDTYSFPVISVLADSIDLFGYSTGIYVPGENFSPAEDKTGNSFMDGDKWKITGNIELFHKEKGYYNCPVEMKIHGNLNKHAPQKSLRLYPHKDKFVSAFQFPFFDNLSFTEYHRIILRNAFSSRNKLITDILIADLATDLGLQSQAWEPIIVFINGEYWGVQNLRERHDEYYIAQHFSINRKSVSIGKNWGENTVGDISSYIEFQEYLRTHDLSV